MFANIRQPKPHISQIISHVTSAQKHSQSDGLYFVWNLIVDKAQETDRHILKIYQVKLIELDYNRGCCSLIN